MTLSKLSIFHSVILTFAFLLSGCQSSQTVTPVANQEIKTATTFTPPQSLKAEEVLNALKAANLPIEKELVFTAEDDPNKLLGRPNQYTGKASWNDKRVEPLTPKDRSMTVEVFASTEDLENRRKYVESVTKAMSPLAEYQYVHKNALLRLNHKLTPQQAAEYEKVLKSL